MSKFQKKLLKGEYKDLTEGAVPIYHLTGKAAKELDKLVREGLKEHEAGRTIKASSLKKL